MSSPDLKGVADAVISQAENQGYVVPRDVRDVLTQAGLPEEHWKDVIALAKPSLRFRQGRYYYLPPVLRLHDRMREENRQKRAMHQAVRQLIRRYQLKVVQNERRIFGRIPFVQPVKIVTDEGREIHCVSRDISLSGIRVLSTHNLLGQKVRVFMPSIEDENEPCCFLVQFLWSARIGDDLLETGGFFLEMQPNL